MPMPMYQLITYDLWPEPEGGWSVNQAFTTDVLIFIPNPGEISDRELIKLLRKQGVIPRGRHASSYDIDGEPDYTLYFTDIRAESQGFKPEFELRRIPGDNPF